MIPFLIVLNQPQRGCGIKDRLGQDALQQEPHLVHRQGRRQVLSLTRSRTRKWWARNESSM